MRKYDYKLHGNAVTGRQKASVRRISRFIPAALCLLLTSLLDYTA